MVTAHAGPGSFASEGGLNLEMPPEVIRGLQERGAHSGKLLREGFGETPDKDIQTTWDNHQPPLDPLSQIATSCGCWRASCRAWSASSSPV